MQLSDTQRVILNAAAQRERLLALPFPDSLRVRGGAATKVVDAMIAKSLLATTPARADDPVWSETDGSGAITLVATADGLSAIGIEPETDAATQPAMDAPKAKGGRAGGSRMKGAPAAPKAKGKANDTAKTPKPGTGTKQEKLIFMLRDPDGASIEEIAAETGWQKHTVRGAIAGALKKKLGLNVQSERVEGRGTVYRLSARG